MANDVKEFLDKFENEKKLRDAIATIVAKLNRSNLSADEGVRQSELLKKAFEHLKELDKGSPQTGAIIPPHPK